ncbi:B3/4 domain-containing protein [Allisonella histaminiformans]|uniref:B3/B4 domain-containing protein n=1 Tax=Allisonella histaminiformans TaxID=209880 RepID=UPI0022E2E910|nr:B3/4 domain-containing protein [Allisonella histaminiformans]
MKKFIIEDSFWDIFPEASIGIITVHGIDNHIKAENRYQPLLEEAEQKGLSWLTQDDFSSNPVIAVWREAFTRFKKKKGVRASIEALLKRVYQGKHIGTINPLVDIYNSISLSYALPVGGEDIDKFEGNIRLTLADGTEPFITLGSNESEPPKEGEVVYKDDAGAICRCWNWRESVRTMLTEEASNVFLCIECVDPERREFLTEAIHALKDMVVGELGGTAEAAFLDRDHKEVVID